MTNLVFFHGWGASGQVWTRQAAAFDHRFTVLTPTIPVWEAGWLADYLRALPLEECVLVGWSLGGMLLVEALSGLPAPRPGGLILVGVAPVFTRCPDYPWGQSAAVVRAMRRGLQTNRQQVLDEFLVQCLAPGEGAFLAPAREAFASSATDGNLAAGLDYLLAKDLRPLLPGVSGGVVIIQGQEDRIVPPDQGKFLAAQLDGARLNLLPGAGHLAFFTQAAAFNGIVEECLITAS